ncbi:hypothetical protein C2857_007837 [Epichloe festucae Fl1]|uniref:Uncharacterized protein n=1 Tax=Epichloe festucae (strain Fl1) TaxID=877507 RepID=A0A7S9PT30_EPIFF|nr:hypothetical protein C2857_007837 [Epichloe festucae Fl1]
MDFASFPAGSSGANFIDLTGSYDGGVSFPSQEYVPGSSQAAGTFVVHSLLNPASVLQDPVVCLVHGDYHTSKIWHDKPDGGKGWASFFLSKGFQVMVIDMPGNINCQMSPEAVASAGLPLQKVDDGIVQHELVAPEMSPVTGWKTSALHLQWPGHLGDVAFYNYKAMTSHMHMSREDRQFLGQNALVTLLGMYDRPTILVGEGTGATMSWLAADMVPHLVQAVVAVEPYGPPGGCPKIRYGNGALLGNGRHVGSVVRAIPGKRPYGISDVPLTFDPPLPLSGDANGGIVAPLRLFPTLMDASNTIYLLQQQDDVVQIGDDGQLLPESTEPAEPRQLAQLKKVKGHLVVTAEASQHSQYDGATVAFLRQAGLEVHWMRLEEHHISGNGHLMFLEMNSDVIAEHILWWLAGTVDGVVLPPAQ